MTTLTLMTIVFLLLFALMMLVISAGLRYLETERKKKVETHLGGIREKDQHTRKTVLFDAENGSAGKRPSFFAELPVVRRLETRMRQAGLDWGLGRLLLLTALGVAVGAYAGSRVQIPVYRETFLIGLAVFLGILPYAYVARKRAKRLAEFEEQFPEALDFMARSLQAGHAFSVSLEMMAEESPDPLATEVRQVFNEQNLGSPLETAMRNFARRVPLIDVRFFVSAILIQRETGGNLAEILTNLSFVIRERFKLKRQVRAVSAHGRLTAAVLTVMPIVTAVILMFVAPDYLRLLAEDPDGKYIVLGAILAQLVGYYFIRRIIKIRV